MDVNLVKEENASSQVDDPNGEDNFFLSKNMRLLKPNVADASNANYEDPITSNENTFNQFKLDQGQLFEKSDVMEILGSAKLAKLDLGCLEVEDWLVISRKKFDLILFEEPFHAILQLLIHPKDGQYIYRVWGKTKYRGHLTSLQQFPSICLEVFEQKVPCAGVFDVSNQENQAPSESLTCEFPFRRKLSRSCIWSYKIGNTTEPTMSELLGIGLCSFCASLVTSPTISRREKSDLSKADKALNKEKSPKKVVECDQQRDDGSCQSFASIAEQYAHKKEDGSIDYRCPHCSHVVGVPRSLTRHMRMHHYLGDFECTFCENFSFKARYLQDLITHWREAHPTIRLSCPCCQQKKFGTDESSDTILEHYLVCNKSLEYQSQKRRMNKKPFLYYEKKHKCPICGKKYLHEYLLKDHMNNHRGLKPHKCKECDFSTSSSASLLHHRKIHLRERGLERTENDGKLYHHCDLCGNKYNTAHYLQQHIRTVHQGIVKKRQCDTCGEVFNNATSLRRHKGREHPTNPSLTCQICNQVCADAYSFNKHSKVHKDPDLICRFCGKALKNKQSLDAHERFHTGENPYHCNLCDYKCKASSVLNKHKAAKHGAQAMGKK